MRGNITAISSRLKKKRLAQQVELEREMKKVETQHQHSVDEAVMMTCPFTEEIIENILRLKNNKSPGVDGLPENILKPW